MYMAVLPVCMSVYHVHAQAYGEQEKETEPLELELRRLRAAMWVLRIKPGPLKEQLVNQHLKYAVCFNTGINLQLHPIPFLR